MIHFRDRCRFENTDSERLCIRTDSNMNICSFFGLVSIIVLLITFGPTINAYDEHTQVCTRETDAISKLIVFLDFFNSIVKDTKEMIDKSSRSHANVNEPMDCSDMNKGGTSNDIYKVLPRNRIVTSQIDVPCDMTDDGGGWTVIQRRGDFNSSDEYFYRDWNSYKTGFGDIRKDFWIGNDNLFALTNQRAYSLKVVMTDWDDNLTYASYDNFWIEDERNNYTLHVDGYRGTAGDSFAGTHNGCMFSTKDRDNDFHTGHCALTYKGAWWYNKCHSSNLNGQYLRGIHETHANGVNWRTFRGHKYSLKDTIMKIRPKNFILQ